FGVSGWIWGDRGVPPDERDAVQKKTFTKWVNAHLARAACRVGDLYSDLRDGFVLTRLLEVLSGETLHCHEWWHHHHHS
uniref:Calponin-homology (CH) domain-containing protein n=1 Tax=Serinus canaria TaxID=9135 RepID=A0A8C9L214_SERCA